jgi:2-amino-4-hydroxy-6-hydroxymethyldihydropteridine diphosphokinase
MNHQKQFRKAYISFGANLAFAGNSPAQTIQAAQKQLDCAQIQLVESASLYCSPAWPDPADPEFTNTVALYMSCLSPLRLMNQLLRVEARFGRVRSLANAPRTLDLDLISYGEIRSNTPRVQLPHPRASNRAFVLLPLQEIAPQWLWQGTGQKIDQLIHALPELDREQTKKCKSV